MQCLLLNTILGHTFWNTSYELRFCREKLIDQLSFLVGRRGNMGGKLQHWVKMQKPHILSKFRWKFAFQGILEIIKSGMGIMLPKACFLSLIWSLLEFSSRDRAGIMIAIINVKKLSRSFNDFPRLTRLVCGRARPVGSVEGAKWCPCDSELAARGLLWVRGIKVQSGKQPH